MKPLIKKHLFVSSLALTLASNGFAATSGFSTVTSMIGANADTYMLTSINIPIPFVISDWSMLATYYSQNSSFPSAGVYAVDTSFLTGAGVTSITNSANGTLEIRYGGTAPGPLANNGYALAPTRVTLRGNTFYIYELPQCFTNITDSMTSQQTPQPGTSIGLFSNSNLGTSCVYAADPYTAAVNEVLGSGTGANPGNGL